MIEIQKDILTGRPTILTDEGSLVDVLDVIEAAVKYDIRLVPHAMYQAYKLLPQQGQSLQ